MEIEKKWKLSQLPKNIQTAERVEIISQGYICTKNGELRVRNRNGQCFITAKSDGDLSREEWETEIPAWVFKQLWQNCCGRTVEKIRHSLMYGELTLEIDEYLGQLSGLITLEIEFASESEAEQFDITVLVADAIDVTADKRYKNKALAVKGLS